ncbi:MAG: hypothetical protein AAFY35_13260 [Pseudomonadota bacterium]
MEAELNALFDVERAKLYNYLASEKGEELLEQKRERIQRNTQRWFRRASKLEKTLRQRGIKVPPDLLRSFDVPYAELLDIQVKYRTRVLNILREFARVHLLLPELTKPPERRVLSLSPGGCGCADVLTYYGHKVSHFDYLEYDDNISINRKLHRALGIKVKHFDGHQRPYKLRKSYYDYLTCYQAVNLYGPPVASGEIILELMEVPRVAGCIILNPIQKFTKEENADYEAETIAQVRAHFDVTEAKCLETDMTAMVIRK